MGRKSAAQEAGTPLIHRSPLSDLYYFLCLSSTFHYRVNSGEAAPEPLLCPDGNKRGDKTTSRWLFLMSSAQFQSFRKVLWPSSSSPASSLANPRTPLWSSPGHSVGATTHTISKKRSHHTHRLLRV